MVTTTVVTVTRLREPTRSIFVQVFAIVFPFPPLYPSRSPSIPTPSICGLPPVLVCSCVCPLSNGYAHILGSSSRVWPYPFLTSYALVVAAIDALPPSVSYSQELGPETCSYLVYPHMDTRSHSGGHHGCRKLPPPQNSHRKMRQFSIPLL